MTINQKLFSVAALAAVISLSSCDNDDDKGSSQLPKDKAKTALTNFNSTAKGDLQDFADADGLKAVQDFYDLVGEDDPFGRIGTDEKKVKAFFRQKGKDFKKVFVPGSVAGRTNGEEPFDFEGNTGTYEWNTAEEVFEKTGENDIVSIKFPTEGSNANNAELQLTAYSEVEVYDDIENGYIYQPETLKASLLVDNDKVASLELDVEWDDYGFPLNADIAFMVSPFTATVSFDVKGATSSTLSVGLLRDQQTIVATSVTVNYSDDSKSEESVKNLAGYVQFRNLKIQGDVDFEAANQNEVNWDDIVKLGLYDGNDKLGDIIFEEENEQAIPYLKYADGTKEKLETVLKPVLDEIENLTGSLQTNG